MQRVAAHVARAAEGRRVGLLHLVEDAVQLIDLCAGSLQGQIQQAPAGRQCRGPTQAGRQARQAGSAQRMERGRTWERERAPGRVKTPRLSKR